MEAVFVGVISRVWPYFLVHAERCAVVTVLFHLICGSFIQTTGREVADLPVSHELGKNIYSIYVQCAKSARGGRGATADFIVPMQLIEVLFCLLQIS